MGIIILGIAALLFIALIVILVVFAVGLKSKNSKKNETMIKAKYKNKK